MSATNYMHFNIKTVSFIHRKYKDNMARKKRPFFFIQFHSISIVKRPRSYPSWTYSCLNKTCNKFTNNKTADWARMWKSKHSACWLLFKMHHKAEKKLITPWMKCQNLARKPWQSMWETQSNASILIITQGEPNLSATTLSDPFNNLHSQPAGRVTNS